MGNLLKFFKNLLQSNDIESNKFVNKEEKDNTDEYDGKKNIVENIRIYLYGKNLDLIYKKNSFVKKPETRHIKDVNYLYIKDYSINAEYLIFDGDITKEKNIAITSLLQENFLKKQFYDIIVVTVDSLEDESTKLFINHFQSSTKQKLKQPFILFLTLKEENPNIKLIYGQLTNKYFDKRNLTAFKYPNENDFSKITNYITEKISYYNGYGDLYDQSNLSTEYLFNILICGISGVGKSSFINMLQHSKRSKEGEGNSVTDKIIRFTHPKYPIGVYDTPGFENEATVIKVKKLLEEYNINLRDERKKINLVLYFLPYTDRLILEMEKTILDYLFKLDCEIIFVINKVVDDIKSDNYLRYEEEFKDEIENNYSKYRDLIHYVPINLYPSYKNGKVVAKAFGLDDLFNKIYEIFQKYKIDIKTIEKITSIEDMLSFLGENKLYSQFREKNDFFLTLKSKSSQYILKYSQSIFYNIRKEKDKKEMITKIYSLYYDKGFEEFYDSINKDILTGDKITELYEDFFNNLKILKTLDKFNDFFLFKSLHDKEAIAIGNNCIKKLEEKINQDPNLFIQNYKPNLNMIKNLCSSINTAIDSFKITSDEFKNVYNLLDNKNNKLDSDNNALNGKEIHLSEIREDTTLKIEEHENDNIKNNGNDNIKNNENDWWTLFF